MGVGAGSGLASHEHMASSATSPPRRLIADGAGPRPRSRWTVLVGVLVAGALLRLVFAALIPLFPDEAYYWEWSRHLAPGYFDHPPAIPLLIRGGTALFGVTSLGVRLLPVLAGFIAALATAGIARRLGGEDAALKGA